MRKLSLLLSMLLVTVLLVAGCSGAKAPKDLLQEAFTKNADVKTSSFDLGMTLAVESKSENMDEETAMAMALLKNAKLSAKGKYDAEKERLETLVTFEITGDMNMSINVPIILEGQKLYVKVPNIPFFPVPTDLVDKYILIDMKELEEQGLTEQNAADVEMLQGLVKEVMAVVLEDFGNEKYVSELKKDAFPAGVTGEHVLQVKVTDDMLKDALTTFIQTTMPKVLKVVEQEKYMTALSLTKEDLDQARTELDASKITEADLAEMREELVLNELLYTLAIDKNSYVTHQNLGLDVHVKEIDATFKVSVFANQTDINTPLEFEMAIPAEGDVVKMDELGQYMSAY